MSKKPNMKMLQEMLAKGKDFSLTDAQYEKNTGAMLPKDKNYLLKRSSLAKLCKKHGYSLKMQEKTVFMEKEK